MEELTVATPKHEPQPWSDARWLLLLLVLTAALRLWLLFHTEVAARDCIGFIRYALQFESQPWAEVIRTNHQHPGYPLAILAASVPVRYWSTEPDTVRMQFSAQLASSVAGLLLIFPMFYLGKRLFNRRVGFWASLIFQCLPVSGHILADGLSEALFLFLAATTLCLAARALDGKSLGRFALCGIFCGLTYLTRPEGLLLLATVFLVLWAMQLGPLWRRSASSLALCSLALIGAALVVGIPYVMVTGRLSTKPSVEMFFHNSPGARLLPTTPADTPPLLATLPAIVLNDDGSLGERFGRGLWSLGAELVKGFHYVCWLPTLVGMILFRRRTWQEPAMALLVLLCILHALVLVRLEMVVGYLSNRHIQLLVLGGVYPAAALLLELPGWLLNGWRAASGGWRVFSHQPPLATRHLQLWSVVLLLALVGVGLPKTLQPLHANRAGHHAAGLWLAQQMRPHDLIEDDHCWAHYYSGKFFLENKPLPPVPRTGELMRYSVVSRRERDIPTRPGSGTTEPELLKRGATVVYYWPANRPVDRADVVVYAQPVPNAGPSP